MLTSWRGGAWGENDRMGLRGRGGRTPALVNCALTLLFHSGPSLGFQRTLLVQSQSPLPLHPRLWLWAISRASPPTWLGWT